MTFRDMYSFRRNRGLKSKVVDDVQATADVFGKKTRYRQIFTNVFQNDSPSVRSTSCVQISWNLADRKSVNSCVIYVTKKNKISARSLAVASVWIAPKICQGQLQTIYSEYPKFHSNPFTSGGVIAGRVNFFCFLSKSLSNFFLWWALVLANSFSWTVLTCVCTKLNHSGGSSHFTQSAVWQKSARSAANLADSRTE